MKNLQTTTVNNVPFIQDYKFKSKDYNSHFGHAGESLVPLSKDMSGDLSIHKCIVSNNKFNSFYNKTAKDISFSGLSISEVNKIKNSFAWKLFNKKWFNNFIAKADSSQTIFDALFALGITCALRPAAIMAQSSEKTKKKDLKAAEHSIASGVIGYGFAILVFSPIKNALDKIKKHPEYFSKKAAGFFKYADKKMNKSMSASKRMQTYTMLFNKSMEILVAGLRSSLTIGMIPYIDKYVFGKLFGTNNAELTKKQLQNPAYRYSIVNFKNNQESNKVFQNFTGLMK